MQGCLEKVEDKITYYAPILIGIGIGVAMIQVDFLFYFFATSSVVTNSSTYYLNTIANSQEFSLFKIVFQ